MRLLPFNAAIFRRGLMVVLALAFAVWLAACAPAAPAPTLEVPSTAAPSSTPEPSATPLPPTETPPPTVEPTATIEEVVVVSSAICSPLTDHLIEKLPEYVSHPFRLPETSNKEEGHHGVDFAYYHKDGVGDPIDGAPIQSVMDGVVSAVGYDRLPYGNMIMVETSYEQLPAEVIDYYSISPDSSLYHLYAHLLDNPQLNVGDPVSCGQFLGQVGNTGFSGNPHLHLETRIGPAGVRFPTMIFYDTTATTEQMETYVWWRSSGDFVMYDPMLLFALVGETP